MNDEVGCLHFFANFDSGNLESAVLVDPLLDDITSSPVSTPSSSGDATRRKLPGAGGKLLTLKDQQYYLSISSDCAGQGSFESAHNRSWFYFGVTFVGDAGQDNAPSSRDASPIDCRAATMASKTLRPSTRHKATFTIVNLLATNLIFDHDNRPVYCSDTMTDWERLPQPLIIQYFDKAGNAVSPPPPSFLQQFHSEQHNAKSNAQDKRFLRGWHQCSQRITWSYTFTSVGETVYFAMCYPFSYHRQHQLIDDWKKAFGEDRGLNDSHVDGTGSTVTAAPTTAVGSSSRYGEIVVPGGAEGPTGRRSSSQIRNNNALGGGKAGRSRTPPPSEVHAASAPSTPAKGFDITGSPRKPQQLPKLQPQCDTPTRSTTATEKSEAPCTTHIPLPPPLKDPSLGVYFHQETLCFSIQNRRVDLLTISGHNGKHPDGLRESNINHVHPVRSETPRPWVFPDKRIVLITCRVHPGETPASHVLHGLIELLLSTKDPRAVALRQLFVFKIVPILNPDGVACGHYRTDTRGVNLNRMYDNPDPRFHPTIYAARELFLNLEATKKLVLYVDLHAHASKRGCFVFGNAWDDDATQVQALLYPKLLSMNSLHFDFPSCDFTSRSMKSGNRLDGTSKGGTGRVALASSGGLVECYTLEASYCTGLVLNNIPTLDADRLHHVSNKARTIPAVDGSSSTPTVAPRRASMNGIEPRRSSFASVAASASAGTFRYSPETYHELGRGILISLLDLFDSNPASRLPLTPHHCVDGVRLWLERQVRMLRAEQMRVDAVEKHKTALEHNRAMERVGTTLNLPTLNAYNNASHHKLTRDESGVVLTVKERREREESSAPTAPLRLLA